MAMDEKATLFLKVRARDALAPRSIRVEGRRPQNDVLPVERAVALANRHRRLPRVVPHRGEAIRLGIEAGDSGAGALRSIGLDEASPRVPTTLIDVYTDGFSPNWRSARLRRTVNYRVGAFVWVPNWSVIGLSQLTGAQR